LAGGLASRGFDVDLVLAKSIGPYMSDIPSGVRVIDLGASRSLTSLPALVRYLRRNRPDAMLSALSRANLVAVWARRLARYPGRLVINEQNTLSQWATKSSKRRVRWTPTLARRFYGWADAVVAVSQGVADDLTTNCGISPEQVRVIFNPGVTPELRKKAAAPLDDPWFKGDQPPVFLAVGSLTLQKDFPTLLEAFARLRRERRARLLILGEGDQRKRLERQIRELKIQDDVRLPGFVDNPYAYMSRAAAFVLSSRWEGLPTVLIEAMYCGLPLIATDCPSGPREILRDGELGCLVSMEQPEELAEAMLRTLDGQTPAAPQDSCRPFSIEHVVDQYVDLLCEPGRYESNTQ
jgi:glycosyltransferase involved in cell wall biosynthesis